MTDAIENRDRRWREQSQTLSIENREIENRRGRVKRDVTENRTDWEKNVETTAVENRDVCSLENNDKRSR